MRDYGSGVGVSVTGEIKHRSVWKEVRMSYALPLLSLYTLLPLPTLLLSLNWQTMTFHARHEQYIQGESVTCICIRRYVCTYWLHHTWICTYVHTGYTTNEFVHMYILITPHMDLYICTYWLHHTWICTYVHTDYTTHEFAHMYILITPHMNLHICTQEPILAVGCYLSCSNELDTQPPRKERV